MDLAPTLLLPRTVLIRGISVSAIFCPSSPSCDCSGSVSVSGAMSELEFGTLFVKKSVFLFLPVVLVEAAVSEVVGVLVPLVFFGVVAVFVAPVASAAIVAVGAVDSSSSAAFGLVDFAAVETTVVAGEAVAVVASVVGKIAVGLANLLVLPGAPGPADDDRVLGHDPVLVLAARPGVHDLDLGRPTAATPDRHRGSDRVRLLSWLESDKLRELVLGKKGGTVSNKSSSKCHFSRCFS